MKHQPMDYLRLDDHYQTTGGGHNAGSQDQWFNPTSSLMSLDEFLEQVSYQEHLAADGKATGMEPIVKVDFR